MTAFTATAMHSQPGHVLLNESYYHRGMYIPVHELGVENMSNVVMTDQSR